MSNVNQITEGIREFLARFPHVTPVEVTVNHHFPSFGTTRFEYTGGYPTPDFAPNGFILPHTDDNTIMGTANSTAIRRDFPDIAYMGSELVVHAHTPKDLDDLDKYLELAESLTNDPCYSPDDYYTELDNKVSEAWEDFLDDHGLPEGTPMPELSEGEHYGLVFDESSVDLWEDMILPLI